MMEKKWAGHAEYMRDRRVAYRILVKRSERKSSMRKWENNIKNDLD
jgi:hypothetical protein